MPYDSGIAFDSTSDRNIGDGSGSQFPLRISPGYISHGGISPGQPNSISLHGGNAGFQATISTSLNQVENNPGPYGSTQACGGNAPRLKLGDYTRSKIAQEPSNSMQVRYGYAPGSSSSKQAPLVGGSSSTQVCGGNAPISKLEDYTRSENAQEPSNSTQVCGGYAPGSSSSRQAPLVSGSRRVGAAVPTTSFILKSADEVMQNNPELCTTTNIRTLTKKLATDAIFGEDVLRQSTVTGNHGHYALDPHKLYTLSTVIRNKVYPDLTIERFKEFLFPQMKSALAELCKTVRRKYRSL